MKSRISFKIVPHAYTPDEEVVCILLDGEVCASIYTDKNDLAGIRLMSAHFAGEITKDNQFPEGVKMDTGENNAFPVPAVAMSFDPRPYTISANKFVRLPKDSSETVQ